MINVTLVSWMKRTDQVKLHRLLLVHIGNKVEPEQVVGWELEEDLMTALNKIKEVVTKDDDKTLQILALRQL